MIKAWELRDNIIVHAEDMARQLRRLDLPREADDDFSSARSIFQCIAHQMITLNHLSKQLTSLDYDLWNQEALMQLATMAHQLEGDFSVISVSNQ